MTASTRRWPSPVSQISSFGRMLCTVLLDGSLGDVEPAAMPAFDSPSAISDSTSRPEASTRRAGRRGGEPRRAPEPERDRQRPLLMARSTVSTTCDVGNPTFEQIVDALLPSASSSIASSTFDMSGQDEDRGVRQLGADRARGVQPFGLVVRRHPNVDDDELRS